MEEKVEKKIERKETDNNSLPNKKKEKYVELLRPRIAKWVESKAYMREQFTIEELAAKLYTNKTYLSSFIREEYGMNFSGWIAHLRIEEAKRMMRENPDQKLIDVAFNVGFSSLAYFFQCLLEDRRCFAFCLAKKKLTEIGYGILKQEFYLNISFSGVITKSRSFIRG